MMNRRHFVGGSLAAIGAASIPFPAFADFLVGSTQASLVAGAPQPKPGEWVRLILGTGVAYQKQIGVATEATETNDLRYFETQVGLPGGACNPNTMKRTYLKGDRFGSLLVPQPVLADVADSGTTLTRWADVEGGQTQPQTDATLKLLDVNYLYDDRPVRIVSSKKETLRLPGPIAYAGPEDSARGPLSAHETTHVVAEFVGKTDAKHRLSRVEIWTTPAIPFGVAKYRAFPKDMEPFDMRVYSYGTRFKSAVSMSLKTIRAMTPDGTYTNAG